MTDQHNSEYDKLEELFEEAAFETIMAESKKHQMLDELMSSIESVIASANYDDRMEMLKRLSLLIIKYRNLKK